MIGGWPVLYSLNIPAILPTLDSRFRGNDGMRRELRDGRELRGGGSHGGRESRDTHKRDTK